MSIIKAYNNPLYLRIAEDGTYITVNPAEQQAGMKLFSIESTEIDSNGLPKGKFFFIPKLIRSSSVTAFNANVLSQAPIEEVPYSQDRMFIDGKELNIVFPPTNVIGTIVSAINNAALEQIGSSYSNIASVVGPDRIRITSPTANNSIIVIFPNGVLNLRLKFNSGEYPGDIPFPLRSYIEDEFFILTQESVTPNNGAEPSGKFFQVKASNGMLRYVSEFDRGLIEKNPRASILFDAFAYMVDRLNGEMSRLVDQIDLSKIDPVNIEYVAYLLGIDLSRIIQEDGTISAREALKNIQRVVTIKGTELSFNLLFNFTGFNGTLIEYFVNLLAVETEITSDIINDFYSRFIIRDSTYRNPVLSFGSFVTAKSDLPVNGFDMEVIKVLSENAIYQFNESTNEWIKAFNSLTPVFGSGSDPDDSIIQLDFRFQNINRPYINIGPREFNELRILTGLSTRPANTDGFSHSLFEYDEGLPLLRAQVVSDNSGPWDLSSSTDKKLNFIVNRTDFVSIDFELFSAQIADYSSVEFDEVKTIIETTCPLVVVIEDNGRLVIRSKRCGSKSSIQITKGNDTSTGNAALGFTLAHKYFVNRRSTQLKIDSGTANPGISAISIPQVTTSDYFLRIEDVNNDDPADGVYTIQLNIDGIFDITSTVPFRDAIFDVNRGYVTRIFDTNDAKPICTVEVIDGEITFINEVYRQQDFTPLMDLDSSQQLAIKSFIRSKTAVANRSGPSANITEAVIPPDISTSFYLRDFVRNTDQPNEPGLSNRITLVMEPIGNNPFNLNENIIKQIKEFVKYIRPVHVRILTLLFATPGLRDHWPIVGDRTADGDYMPGFWDGSQSVEFRKEFFSGPGSVFSVQMQMLNSIGDPTVDPNDVSVWLNGTLLTPAADYTISGTNVTLLIPPIGATDVLAVGYNHTDGKYPWELDIVDSLIFGRVIKDGWFTDGDEMEIAGGDNYYATSGENSAPEFSTPAGRTNKFLDEVTLESFSNGLGTPYYDNGWYVSGALALRPKVSTNVTHNAPGTYVAQKKPMITDVINAAMIVGTSDFVGTSFGENIIAGSPPYNPNIPYYESSHYLHRGHTRQDLPEVGAPVSIQTEAHMLNNFYFRGIHNGAIGGDWETMGVSSLAAARLGTPYFHGSENYDGGSNGTEFSYDLGNNSLNNQYTDSDDPNEAANRHYRNSGMHNAENTDATVIWAAVVPDTQTHVIINGEDSETGDDIATILTDTSVNHKLLIF